jgi:hypothetical protein
VTVERAKLLAAFIPFFTRPLSMIFHGAGCFVSVLNLARWTYISSV